MADLFKVPSIKKVIDCSEAFIIKDSCDKTAATPTLSTNILSSASSLSSSNSIKDGSVVVIKGMKSCNCKEKNVEVDVSLTCVHPLRSLTILMCHLISLFCFYDIHLHNI